MLHAHGNFDDLAGARDYARRAARPSRRVSMTTGSRPADIAVDDARANGLVLADDAEARRLDELEAAVALALVTGDEHMQRRREAERGGVRGNVVDDSVRHHDRGADALARDVLQPFVERLEQFRAIRLRRRERAASMKRGSMSPSLASAGSSAARAASVCAMRSPKRLALAAIEHDRHDRLQTARAARAPAKDRRAPAERAPKSRGAEARRGRRRAATAARRPIPRRPSAASAGQGSSGVKVRESSFIGRAAPEDRAHGPDRICNCRSACTSRD